MLMPALSLSCTQVLPCRGYVSASCCVCSGKSSPYCTTYRTAGHSTGTSGWPADHLHLNGAIALVTPAPLEATTVRPSHIVLQGRASCTTFQPITGFVRRTRRSTPAINTCHAACQAYRLPTQLLPETAWHHHSLRITQSPTHKHQSDRACATSTPRLAAAVAPISPPQNAAMRFARKLDFVH